MRSKSTFIPKKIKLSKKQRFGFLWIAVFVAGLFAFWTFLMPKIVVNNE